MEPVRILIVDDEEPICRLTQAVLKKKGYEVEYSLDGIGGIQLVKTFNPHIVILDIIMPSGSGIDVLREMLAVNPDIKAVMMSGLHDLGVAREAIRLGAKEYFVKPINFEMLLAMMAKLAPDQTA